MLACNKYDFTMTRFPLFFVTYSPPPICTHSFIKYLRIQDAEKKSTLEWHLHHYTIYNNFPKDFQNSESIG